MDQLMNQQNEKQFDLYDYLRILYRGRWIILISFVTVFAFVVYYTFNAIPIFQSTVKVMVKDEGGVQKTLFNVTNYMQRETKINNQVEILQSRTMAEYVVRKLFASEYADKLAIIGNGKNGKKGGMGIKKKMKKVFVSIFGERSTENTGYVTLGGNIRNKKFDGFVNVIKGSMRVEPTRNTDMIAISMTATSPVEAAYLANTVAVVYKEQNQLESQEEVSRVKDFLKSQLTQFQAQLDTSEQALKEYKEREKVVALPEEINELVSKSAEFESLYHGANLELNSNKERLSYIDEQLDKNKQNINMENILSAPFLAELSKQMAELETKKATYSAQLMDKGVYNPDDPTIRNYERQAKVLADKYKDEVKQLAVTATADPVALSETLLQRKIEVEATIQSLLPRATALKKIVDEYNAKLEKVPDRGLKLARLQRAALLDEKITLMMKEKYEESRITEVGQLGNVRIIDPAKPNYTPISPKKKMNIILGIIVGLGLGIGITFLLEYFDNTVSSVDDIERRGLSLLGSIPLIKLEEGDSKVWKGDKSSLNGKIKTNESRTIAGRLITHLAPKSPVSEAYRSLRTSIQYSKTDTPLKSIVFSSPGPKEGKSTTVVNLAITIAQMGTKVLLVDTDLRRPVIHSIFDLDKSKGISNYLVGRISLEEAIMETDIDNLFVMPSGTLPPNPSELLGSKAMKKCINDLKDRFDLVLFDSPPIMAVTDAVVLSSEVDGVVLVIKEGQTKRDSVSRCNDILKNMPNRILGAVMNGINVDGFYGSYYYYYYHYGYYGKEEGKKTRRSKKV
ncbi:polysaccharide biosynthesis tyrosine autokinase [candidate division KSB1 bacterium]|nr:polysaccharide biosynthesis tyrosine autokinase [candidate division KSB1 bacterium]